MDIDLEAAGIPKHAPGGKVDFHAARVAYITLVLESGVSVKEAQVLARHSTPEMTMNVYGRTRKEKLSEAVEQVAKAIETQGKYVPSMQRLAVGAEQESATPNTDKELRSIKIGGGGVHHIIRENFLLGGLLTPTRTPTSSPVLSRFTLALAWSRPLLCTAMQNQLERMAASSG
jgi:hypothetical protein